MNVTNCHSNPQSCDKVDYEVYEEGDGSSGPHTIDFLPKCFSWE